MKNKLLSLIALAIASCTPVKAQEGQALAPVILVKLSPDQLSLFPYSEDQAHYTLEKVDGTDYYRVVATLRSVVTDDGERVIVTPRPEAKVVEVKVNKEGY